MIFNVETDLNRSVFLIESLKKLRDSIKKKLNVVVNTL